MDSPKNDPTNGNQSKGLTLASPTNLITLDSPIGISTSDEYIISERKNDDVEHEGFLSAVLSSVSEDEQIQSNDLSASSKILSDGIHSTFGMSSENAYEYSQAESRNRSKSIIAARATASSESRENGLSSSVYESAFSKRSNDSNTLKSRSTFYEHDNSKSGGHDIAAQVCSRSFNSPFNSEHPTSITPLGATSLHNDPLAQFPNLNDPATHIIGICSAGDSRSWSEKIGTIRSNLSPTSTNLSARRLQLTALHYHPTDTLRDVFSLPGIQLRPRPSHYFDYFDEMSHMNAAQSIPTDLVSPVSYDECPSTEDEDISFDQMSLYPNTSSPVVRSEQQRYSVYDTLQDNGISISPTCGIKSLSTKDQAVGTQNESLTPTANSEIRRISTDNIDGLGTLTKNNSFEDPMLYAGCSTSSLTQEGYDDEWFLSLPKDVKHVEPLYLPTLHNDKDNHDVSQVDQDKNRRFFMLKNDEDYVDFKNEMESEQQVEPRSILESTSLSKHVKSAKDSILPTSIIDDTTLDEEEKGLFTPPGSISRSILMTSPPPIKETVLTQRVLNRFQ